MAKDIMKMLNKLEGAVTERKNPFLRVVRTPSPSVNFVFGKGHGLPLGYTALLGGPPKGGKTLLVNSIVGQLHQDDPEAIAIKFDTEFREEGQLSEDQQEMWGMDPARYIAYSVNDPEMVFDRIEKDIDAACQEDPGKIKLVIIDSITGILGRRAMNAEGIMTQQIGDEAKTLGDGLKRILAIQRKNKFALILTCHIRAEMDMAEQMRGNKVRMAVAYAVKHHCEYFLMVEPNQSKLGKENLLGEKFEDTNLTDLMDKNEKTGHKIRVVMKDSSMGPKGRTAEFTLDYNRGIVNIEEEVFLLGVNRGIIEHPNNTSYEFGGKKWVGKPAMLKALKDDQDLQKSILKVLFERDLNGQFQMTAEEAANAAEEND